MNEARITPDDVRHVASLARIAVTDQEVAGLIGDLSRVLAYVGQLRELDLSGVEPLARVSDDPGRLGDDVPGPTLDIEALRAMAPAWDDRYVRVPKVLGEGGA
ncbi:MAG: Asp-tRNA(Asn)/Glu-tRNA(Gln) amidotransferase subunit GatC [Phycisphaeraceae bacterium]|nr:Asp-tRNA(Asn)/Glu-tRNA(Gln) amidotransferase subunit GatC [Phycisphaerae bacterium]MBX3392568.1 Asp-tRNA(Asn)/Glu-tRNA(Gln) amidotransferase subunit GatC [Phycisphaeraceae bacterium]